MFCYSNKSRLLSGIFACSVAVLGAEKAAAATNDILFIVDGSGSMWGQIDGVAKIQTAKDTMTNLLDDVPSDSRIGLMTYGTNDKKSCDDVTLVNQFSTDRGAVKTALATLKP
ncbi:MAG: VWA domain-containing protein, partial [Sneathiellales bacterium]|nr:VWA domain-containing protein [Sneathiellales bacterium]